MFWEAKLSFPYCPFHKLGPFENVLSGATKVADDLNDGNESYLLSMC